MKQTTYFRYTLNILWIIVAICILYGLSRLYFHSTAGFSLHYIRSDLSYNPEWETRDLSPEEVQDVEYILSQKFTYLGKGCQSYVFGSEDGDYVIKFLKYQRMRAPSWIKSFTFVPTVNNYYLKKVKRKEKKRLNVFRGWHTAFEHLAEETGVVFVHLNKSNHLNRSLQIVNKAGLEISLWIDDYEFMIQKRASMLCDEIEGLVSDDQEEEALHLLQNLVTTIISEYQRGFADNDHALMQNTGVYYGKPLHIDVGQFVFDPSATDPEFYNQELYTKMYKFRIWLRQNYPTLCDQLECYLREKIGPQFDDMQPHWSYR